MDPFKKWLRQKRAKEKRKKLMEELKMPKETTLMLQETFEEIEETTLMLQETLKEIEEKKKKPEELQRRKRLCFS